MDVADIVQAALLAASGLAFIRAARQLDRLEERMRDAELDLAECCTSNKRKRNPKAGRRAGDR